jgi:hypothetical protein
MRAQAVAADATQRHALADCDTQVVAAHSALTLRAHAALAGQPAQPTEACSPCRRRIVVARRLHVGAVLEQHGEAGSAS